MLPTSERARVGRDRHQLRDRAAPLGDYDRLSVRRHLVERLQADVLESSRRDGLHLIIIAIAIWLWPSSRFEGPRAACTQELR